MVVSSTLVSSGHGFESRDFLMWWGAIRSLRPMDPQLGICFSTQGCLEAKMSS